MWCQQAAQIPNVWDSVTSAVLAFLVCRALPITAQLFPPSRNNPQDGTCILFLQHSIEQQHWLWNFEFPNKINQIFPTIQSDSINIAWVLHLSSYLHGDHAGHSDSGSVKDPRMFGLRTMFFVVQDLVQLFGLLKYGLRLWLELDKSIDDCLGRLGGLWHLKLSFR